MDSVGSAGVTWCEQWSLVLAYKPMRFDDDEALTLCGASELQERLDDETGSDGIPGL